MVGKRLGVTPVPKFFSTFFLSQVRIREGRGRGAGCPRAASGRRPRKRRPGNWWPLAANGRNTCTRGAPIGSTSSPRSAPTRDRSISRYFFNCYVQHQHIIAIPQQYHGNIFNFKEVPTITNVISSCTAETRMWSSSSVQMPNTSVVLGVVLETKLDLTLPKPPR